MMTSTQTIFASLSTTNKEQVQEIAQLQQKNEQLKNEIKELKQKNQQLHIQKRFRLYPPQKKFDRWEGYMGFGDIREDTPPAPKPRFGFRF